MPDPQAARSSTVEEENYFFRLSRFQDRLLEWYAAHPGAIVPEFRGNEALGLIRGGLRDFSVSRTSLKWGIPLPWDAKHVAYVWFDALANYLTAVGYGTDRERFDEWWPAHHLIGKDIIRHHCVYWPAMLMSAGIEPPAGWAVGGWLLVGGEKMSKTTGNVVNPLDLIDEFGVDGFRYYVLAETPYGHDGDFTYEGLTSRYNSDLANNLGNLLSRVATVVGKKCGGIGAGTASRLAARGCSRVRVRGDCRGMGRRRSPVAPSTSTWSLIRATNAYLEANEPWKAEPGPEVDAVMGDALEALRIVAVLASPAMPDTCQTSGNASASAVGSTTNACRPRPTWGGYPGGLPVTKGEPLFPRKGGVIRPVSYIDSHCHLYDTRGVAVDDVIAAARAAGVTTMINVGCDAATTEQAIDIAASHDGIFATAGLHPHEAKHGVDTIVPFLDDPNVIAIGECGLDYFYDHSPRDEQRAAFAAQIQLAHERRLPLVIHTRDAWADTFDVLDAEGTPERTIFHCFTGGPDEARRCLDLARSCRSAAS